MSLKLLRQVCAETGVSRRAVQGYEKAGLVSAVGKNKYGYLLYDTAGIERIRTIHFFQKAGFSIKEIQRMLNEPPICQKQALLTQMEKLQAHIKETADLIKQIERYISEL